LPEQEVIVVKRHPVGFDLYPLDGLYPPAAVVDDVSAARDDR